MGYSKSECILIRMVIICFSFVRFVQGSFGHNNVTSLDVFIHNHAQQQVQKPRTGTLYNLSLPSNFSGIEASFVRLRSSTFWRSGTNSSSSSFSFGLFHFPPRILPIPFVKRIQIVYSNLGNWSSYYFNVPNHTFITPVVGFSVYEAVNSTGMVHLDVSGDPILVYFSGLSLNNNVMVKCVTFYENGSFYLSQLVKPKTCSSKDHGHFGMVVASVGPPSSDDDDNKKKERVWKWWVIGFVVCIFGLFLLCLVVFWISKMVGGKRMGRMQRESERSEPLEIVWIGRSSSKMPSATSQRTQPVLENDYVP